MDNVPETNSGGVGSRPAKHECLRNSSGDRNGGTENIEYETVYTGDEPCEDKDDTDSEITDAEVNPDNKASQLMEHLVRRHLESVMESH